MSQSPHVSWYLVQHFPVVGTFYTFFNNRVVSQVAKQILAVSRIIVVTAESDIALFVHVYLERVPRRDDDPHAHVEFSVHYKQRVLDVLLNYPFPVLDDMILVLCPGRGSIAVLIYDAKI